MKKEELIEKLAEIEHQRWSDWQAWVHKQMRYADETADLLLPQGLVVKWQKQIDTPYSELSEEDKEKDREQVRRYWHLIEEFLAQ